MGDSTLPDLRRVHPRSTVKTPIGGTINLGRKAAEARDQPPPPPALLAPQEPLTWLAEATGGEVVFQPSGLAARPGPPALPLTRCAGEAPREMTAGRARWRSPPPAPTSAVKARRWDVAGIPESIAAARGRPAAGRRGGRDRARDLLPPPAGPQPAAGGRRADRDPRPADRIAGDPRRPPAPHRRRSGAGRRLSPRPDRRRPRRLRAQRLSPAGPSAGGGRGGRRAGGAAGRRPLGRAGGDPGRRRRRRRRAGAGLGVPARHPPGAAGRHRADRQGPAAGERRRGGDRPRRPQAGRAARPPAAPRSPARPSVDLGRRARPQVVQGVAYDAAGKDLARDAVRLNDPDGELRRAHRRARRPPRRWAPWTSRPTCARRPAGGSRRWRSTGTTSWRPPSTSPPSATG